MADGFEELIDASNIFFSELAQNNNKAWFEQRKMLYRETILKPAELFSELVAEDLSRRTKKPHTAKVFRIYRDVRFSKDKTPYNAHLHLLWKQVDATDGSPAWFLGSSPDYLVIGMGVMNLSGAALTRYRRLVDERGDFLSSELDRMAAMSRAELSAWGAPMLKRVPKPYAADHPNAELLKRKSFVLSAPMEPAWRDKGILSSANATTDIFMPLWTLLDETFAKS